MKLDELKDIWEDYTEDTPKMKQEELESLLKGRTHTALQKIQRSIKLEGGFLVLFILVFATLSLLNFGFYQKIIATFLIVFSTFTIILYTYFSRKLNKILFIDKSLESALTKLISLLDRFKKIYLYGTIILTPFSFFSGFFYGFFAFGGEEAKLSLKVIGIGFLYMLILMLFIYPMTKWIIKKLYGKYIEQLKEVHQELLENNE